MRARTRLALAVSLLLTSLVGIVQPQVASAAPPEGFASPQIRAVWERDDGPVASGKIARTWMWGPGPFFTNYEPYREAQEGNHLVQYFDKGRLEINNPAADKRSPWYVTSGLLVKEMVSGKAQVGDNAFYGMGPANIPVAGDGSDQRTPTYATFARLTAGAPNQDGQYITDLVEAGAIASLSAGPDDPRKTHFEPVTGHNWADMFWGFVNSPDRPSNFQWLPTLGYPITEPYWIHFQSGGSDHLALVQLFERRALTYTPDHPSATRIEMGNVGRHYYQWRYANLHSANLDAKYNVNISIGPAPVRPTHVKEEVSLTNNTGRPLSNVVQRAVWHNWDGVFKVQAAIVDGQQAQARWRSGVNLEITLPRPVNVGERISILLQFDLTPRPVGGRTGYDRTNDILSLGDVLPTVVPWENGGWTYYPYSDLGDLGYYGTSDYVVKIATSGNERLIVGGTGAIASVEADRTEWQFNAPNVRDVAYVVSPRFMDPLSQSSMRRNQGNTTVLAYFLPEHEPQGQRQLDLILPALAWFGQKVGPYPFDSYTVAEMGVPLERTDNYAQEYPMSYFIPTTWLGYGTTPGTWTWYTPVHEVGHQWFYSTVGSNQLEDPWLDEAMTTYITTEYVRSNFPGLYAQAWGTMSNGATTARPVSSGVYSGFANENQYSATIYDTGIVMLDKVRATMGDAAFYSALKDYYRKFQFARARPSDLTNLLQAHTNSDLAPIFSRYLGR